MKKKIHILCREIGWFFPTLLGLIIGTGLLYAHYLRNVVSLAYHGRTVSILNNLISGQKNYDVNYYLNIADYFFYKFLYTSLFFLSLFVLANMLFILKNKYNTQVVKLAVLAFSCNFLLISPPVFEKLFSLQKLSGVEQVFLFFLVVILVSSLLLALKLPEKILTNVLCIFFSLLFFLNIELGVRLVLQFFPQQKQAMASLADRTYPEKMRYIGHPFLHFTGSPLAPAPYFSYLPARRYNSFGFVGPEFSYKKPEGAVRIACLGGSTTESGYPAVLEKRLNACGGDKKFEVMNFGLAAWNSGHSLVNYVLNVRDFSPDYVVIHHGWNDGKQQVIGSAARGDYSCGLKLFSPYVPWDSFLIRTSVMYRYLKNLVNPKPSYAMLEFAMGKSVDDKQTAIEPSSDGTISITHLERNLKTIISLAIIDRAHVILTTMPHSTDPAVPGYDRYAFVDKNNALIRRVAGQYDEADVSLVDLDKKMTGSDNGIYVDFAHVNDTGKQMKAEMLAKAIANNCRE